MAIGYIKRIAGPFTGAGTKELPFGFMVYAATDVYVALAASDNATAETLEYGTDYTVTLNDDQETTPGGTVTLVTALTAGQVAAVGSDLDYTQPTQLTNFSRFPPEIINDALDRIVILIQQLVEKLDRAVMVPTTSSMTPDELVAKLESAADTAEQVAASYAAQAQASAASASASAQKAEDAVQGLEDKESELEGKLEDFTDTQIARIEDAADMDFVFNVTGCAEKQWTLTSNVSANTAITIPGELYYLVGRHHLRVSYNGLVCYIGENFTEVGNTDTKSNQFKLTFDAKSGDELDVWIAALGKADVADAIATATAANDAVAELSQKVVYKDAESAGS